ncbi:NIPSNAP protein [Bradyrhizobium erythrophlei]|nr:NIPSNAP protein [Bradyrhizobium erythrophlei]
MIVEERIYSIIPGQLGAYLKIYTSGPLDLQKRILGKLLGYFTTEVGELSTLVHLWCYESLNDRAERRALLAQDPEWQTYLEVCTPLIVRMENRLLLPTDFSPIR